MEAHRRRSAWAAARNALIARIPARTPPDAAPTPPPADPAEWGGVTPWLDWDPANATESGGDVTILLDSSGNNRHALVGDIGIVGPAYIASDASLNNLPALSWPGDVERKILTPSAVPAGAFSVAFVGYTDPVVGSNNFAFHGAGDSVAIYAARAGDLAFHAWASPDFAEPTPSVDFSTTPTILLLTTSGESAPAASDAVVKFYARSLAPATLTGKAPMASAVLRLGENSGAPGPANSLLGACGRFIVWNADVSAQASTILNALATKYGLSLLP